MWRWWLVLALGCLLLIVPGSFSSPLGGVPLTQAARWAFVALFFLGGVLVVFPPRSNPRLRWVLLLALLIVAKLAVARSSVPEGWGGVYEMRDVPPETALFSWRFATHPFRIDRTIDFEDLNFGLHFINNPIRYGALISPQTRDVQLPLRVTWTGYFMLRTDTPLAFQATARGRVSISLDGASVASLENPVRVLSMTPTPVRNGARVVQISYDKPVNTSPLASVFVTAPGQPNLIIRPSQKGLSGDPSWQAFAASATDGLVGFGLGLVLVLLPWSYGPAPGVSAIVRSWRVWVPRAATLAVFGWLLYLGARNAIPWLNTTFHLWSGDDPLAYVGYARNILERGLLMPGYAQPGHGDPYYFYPLYSYILAAGHFLIGEDYAVVRLVNGLAVVSLVPLFWRFGWKDLPVWAVLVGLAGLGWFVYKHLLPYALIGYSDSAFIAIVFVALILCTRAFASGRPWHCLLAGLSCAAAAATRPSFLTFTPLLLVSFVVFMRGFSLRARLDGAGFTLAGFVLGLLPFTIRNWLMSGKLVVLVASWIQIPYFLIPPERPNPIGARLAAGVPSLGESIGWAVQILRDDPAGVVRIELRKIVFTLGFTQFGMPGGSVFHPDLLALTGLFGLAVVLKRLPYGLRAVLLLFAVTHLTAMVLAAPWTYGYKTILPLHAVFLFGAAYLLDWRRPVSDALRQPSLES